MSALKYTFLPVSFSRHPPEAHPCSHRCTHTCLHPTSALSVFPHVRSRSESCAYLSHMQFSSGRCTRAQHAHTLLPPTPPPSARQQALCMQRQEQQFPCTTRAKLPLASQWEVCFHPAHSGSELHCGGASGGGGGRRRACRSLTAACLSHEGKKYRTGAFDVQFSVRLAKDELDTPSLIKSQKGRPQNFELGLSRSTKGQGVC